MIEAKRKPVIHGWVLLAAILTVGTLCAWWMANRADQILRRDLMPQAQLVAKAVDARAWPLDVATVLGVTSILLVTLFGFLYVLLRRTDQGIQRQQAALIESETFLNLTGQMAKVDGWELTVEMIDCSLGKLLNSLEAVMKPLAVEKSVEFKVTTGDDLPAQIHSDPYRLYQCLMNLANNALKFTDQGHVCLRVLLREEGGTHFVQFDVEDTGIGIPRDRQKVISESFSQADGSTARKYGGTGLGLTITQQLTELLGGELTLASEPNRGSVFSLSIPIGMDIAGQPLLDRHKDIEAKTVDSASAQTRESERCDAEPGVSTVRTSELEQDTIDEIIHWGLLIDKLGDEETIREIMPIYTKDIRTHFDKLAQAVADGDCVAVASHAHALKGVGRNLSIEQLSETAAQMETVARKNDIEASTRLFDGLETNLEQIMAVLSQSDWIEKAKALSTVASI